MQHKVDKGSKGTLHIGGFNIPTSWDGSFKMVILLINCIV